ncbi:nitroreductase family protein [Aneurinibacillus sp. UBA3580]|jgi:nitroreductase|uniref:nitroreductase family protein n=1 Tax=Aneurinibacillus sp. UBA3580 TaxID=1946041 RepID=UPI00257CBEEE|nr:nitroreductase family protein [Aneurinibacillus sp. UBA3580]
MDYEQFKAVMLGRRSVRKFEDKAVQIEQIREIIDCARHAPSDTNAQAWEFIAIMNKEKIEKLSAMVWEELRTIAEEAKQRGMHKEARMLLRSFGPYAASFADAPVLIVCLATSYTSKFREKIFAPLGLIEDSVYEEEGIKSSCLASQNLMLAAHAAGLATCPMTAPVFFAKHRFKEYLNIADYKQITMVIALGYPVDLPAKPPRKDIDDILHIIS